MVNLRLTSESLKQDTSVVTSNEIRADRQRSDVIRTAISVSGDIQAEMSADTFDDWILDAVMATGTTFAAGASHTALTLTFAATTITRASGSWTTDGYAVGDWFVVTGAVNAANNSAFKIASVTATVITVVQTGVLVVETSTAGCSTIRAGAATINGTTLRSRVIEREYTDAVLAADKFVRYGGNCINTMGINVSQAGIVTLSFGLIGQSEGSFAATLAGSTTAATSTPVMNSVDHVKCLIEGLANQPASSFSLNLSNNLRARTRIGTLGTFDVGKGTIDLSGSIDVYFDTRAMMDRYLSFAQTSMSLVFVNAGKGYVFEMPAVRLTGGQRVAGGINTDIMATMQWTAFRDSVTNSTLRVHKIG
jgi:hypothetical protein